MQYTFSSAQKNNTKVVDVSAVPPSSEPFLLPPTEEEQLEKLDMAEDCKFLIIMLVIIMWVRVTQWSEPPYDTRVESIPGPIAHQAFHFSGVGELVIDLSRRIARLTRYIGRPPGVIL